MHPQFVRSTILASATVSLLLAACQTPESPAGPHVTNATVTFTVAGNALERPTLVRLDVAKPRRAALSGGNQTADGTTGCREFPAGTRAVGIVRYYAGLLVQRGWVDGQDFVAAENALHFYGISQLGGGSGDSGVGVHGATDSTDVPFRSDLPASR